MRATDPVAAQYYAEVGKYALPTKEEERKLFAAYAEARHKKEFAPSSRDRSKGARDQAKLGRQIACGYVRFVIQQAGRKTNDPTLLKDLIGQGNIGLMVGIERFSLDFNTRFLTYAAGWIRVHMQEYLHKLGTVHVPSHTRKEMRKRTKSGFDAPPTQTLEFEEPQTVDFDDVAVCSGEDTQADASRRESAGLHILGVESLSLPEKMVLIYAFGLRGVEMGNAQLAQMLYELGLGAHTAKSLNELRCTALEKLKDHFAAKGIKSLADVL